MENTQKSTPKKRMRGKPTTYQSLTDVTSEKSITPAEAKKICNKTISQNNWQYLTISIFGLGCFGAGFFTNNLINHLDHWKTTNLHIEEYILPPLAFFIFSGVCYYLALSNISSTKKAVNKLFSFINAPSRLQSHLPSITRGLVDRAKGNNVPTSTAPSSHGSENGDAEKKSDSSDASLETVFV